MLDPMETRSALALLPTLLVLAACGSVASPTGGEPVAGGGSGNPSLPAASAPEQPGESLDLPDIEMEFPPACGVATADELAATVGNPLFDGTGFTSLICDWGSDGGDTSVSLLLQPVSAQFCTDGLPEGEATDQFGGQGAISYSDTANVPGAQIGVCVDPGLVLLTVTGAYGGASDEARYTGQAVEVMELVLSRL